MTTFCWSLKPTRLEEDQLFSKLVTYCFENVVTNNENLYIEEKLKNSYCHIKCRKLQYFRKLRFKKEDFQIDCRQVNLHKY